MESKLYDEFEKFVKQQVVVKYHEGDKVIELKGELRFLNFSYLNCVVMTEKEKIIVKNIITITRQRKSGS